MKRAIVCTMILFAAAVIADETYDVAWLIKDTEKKFDIDMYYNPAILLDRDGKIKAINRHVRDVTTLAGRLSLIECIVSGEVIQLEQEQYAIRTEDREIAELKKKLDDLTAQQEALAECVRLLQEVIVDLCRQIDQLLKPASP